MSEISSLVSRYTDLVGASGAKYPDLYNDVRFDDDEYRKVRQRIIDEYTTQEQRAAYVPELLEALKWAMGEVERALENDERMMVHIQDMYTIGNKSKRLSGYRALIAEIEGEEHE